MFADEYAEAMTKYYGEAWMGLDEKDDENDEDEEEHQ